jgi:hypothetical protein
MTLSVTSTPVTTLTHGVIRRRRRRVLLRDDMLDRWIAEGVREAVAPSERGVAQQLATTDFLNYLKKFWGLLGCPDGEARLHAKLARSARRQPEELRQFLRLWLGQWRAKWRRRVKVLAVDEKPPVEAAGHLTPRSRPPVDVPNEDEMVDLVIEVLINHGEVCGTVIVARELIADELRAFLRLYEEEASLGDAVETHILGILNRVLRRARKLAREDGPLIFLKLERAAPYGRYLGAE